MVGNTEGPVVFRPVVYPKFTKLEHASPHCDGTGRSGARTPVPTVGLPHRDHQAGGRRNRVGPEVPPSAAPPCRHLRVMARAPQGAAPPPPRGIVAKPCQCAARTRAPGPPALEPPVIQHRHGARLRKHEQMLSALPPCGERAGIRRHARTGGPPHRAEVRSHGWVPGLGGRLPTHRLGHPRRTTNRLPFQWQSGRPEQCPRDGGRTPRQR